MRYTHRVFAAAVFLAVPAVVSSLAAAADAPAIIMKNFDFSPMTLSVPAGAAVTWTNKDGEPHTVVSETALFRSKALDEGDSFTYKFDKPGTYHFLCSIHPKMRGTITVR